MSSRARLCAARLVVLLSLAAPVPLRAGDEIRESDLFFTDATNLARLLEEARAALDAGQPALAAEQATRILDTARAAEAGAPGTIAVDALLLRARARLETREKKAAIADLEQALALDAALALPARERSPFATLLAETRRRLVGRLDVDSTPAGATVTLEGRRLGRTPISGAVVLSGRRFLRFERPGFAALEREVEVLAGKPSRVSVTLERRGSTLLLLVDAEPAEIRLDGKIAGRALRPAPEAAERLVSSHNLPIDVEQPPALLLIEDVTAGVHAITIHAPCRKPFDGEVEVPESADATATFSLQPAGGSLRIAGAREVEVRVDGEARGRPPLLVEPLCPGPHRIDAVRSDGRETRFTVTVAEDAETAVEVAFRPVIALLQPDPELARALSESGGFDVLYADDVAGADPAMLLDDQGRPRHEPVDLLAQATGADLLAWRDSAAAGTPIVLLVPGAPAVERLPIAGTGLLAAAGQLAAPIPLTRADAGLVLLETALAAQPLVAALGVGGPAQAAGLRVGDELLQLGGAEIRSLADFDRALGAATPGAPVAIAFRRQSGLASSDLVPREAALDPDFSRGAPTPSAAVARLRHRLAEPGLGETLRTGTRLALAKAWMALEAWPLALAVLEDLSLPGSEGVSAGTVDYYRALAAHRSGQPTDARTAVGRALARPGARLGGPDGPPVLPLARQLAEQLGLPEPD